MPVFWWRIRLDFEAEYVASNDSEQWGCSEPFKGRVDGERREGERRRLSEGPLRGSRRLRVQAEFLYASLKRHAIHPQQARCLTDIIGAFEERKFDELLFHAIGNVRVTVSILQ